MNVLCDVVHDDVVWIQWRCWSSATAWYMWIAWRRWRRVLIMTMMWEQCGCPIYYDDDDVDGLIWHCDCIPLIGSCISCFDWMSLMHSLVFFFMTMAWKLWQTRRSLIWQSDGELRLICPICHLLRRGSCPIGTTCIVSSRSHCIIIWLIFDDDVLDTWWRWCILFMMNDDVFVNDWWRCILSLDWNVFLDE